MLKRLGVDQEYDTSRTDR